MFASLPLTALRSFEAAARLGSFRNAASELAVTPTAVSHQIRQLEAWLGIALFTRLPQGVALTPNGEQLFRHVHDALLEITRGAAALRPVRPEGSVTLATTPSFAALWLVPRLGRFYTAHPGIEVRLIGSGTVADLHTDASIDLAIRYAVPETAALLVHARLDETFGVYGANALIARSDERPPAVVTVRWGRSTLYVEAWRAWRDAAGLDWPDDRTVVHAYDEEVHAMQAAIAGQGLVLASSVLISDAVRHGLVRPYRHDVSVAGSAYTVVSVPGRERHPPVRAFLDWLKTALAESSPAAVSDPASPSD